MEDCSIIPLSQVEFPQIDKKCIDLTELFDLGKSLPGQYSYVISELRNNREIDENTLLIYIILDLYDLGNYLQRQDSHYTKYFQDLILFLFDNNLISLAPVSCLLEQFISTSPKELTFEVLQDFIGKLALFDNLANEDRLNENFISAFKRHVYSFEVLEKNFRLNEYFLDPKINLQTSTRKFLVLIFIEIVKNLQKKTKGFYGENNRGDFDLVYVEEEMIALLKRELWVNFDVKICNYSRGLLAYLLPLEEWTDSSIEEDERLLHDAGKIISFGHEIFHEAFRVGGRGNFPLILEEGGCQRVGAVQATEIFQLEKIRHILGIPEDQASYLQRELEAYAQNQEAIALENLKLYIKDQGISALGFNSLLDLVVNWNGGNNIDSYRSNPERVNAMGLAGVNSTFKKINSSHSGIFGFVDYNPAYNVSTLFCIFLEKKLNISLEELMTKIQVLFVEHYESEAYEYNNKKLEKLSFQLGFNVTDEPFLNSDYRFLLFCQYFYDVAELSFIELMNDFTNWLNGEIPELNLENIDCDRFLTEMANPVSDTELLMKGKISSVAACE